MSKKKETAILPLSHFNYVASLMLLCFSVNAMPLGNLHEVLVGWTLL
jgi:hypothetical protein